ncbi:type IV secretion system protein [Moraxella sp. FZLJ2109]
MILAAVGSLFFGFALFSPTRTYFTNWAGQVLNYGFISCSLS